MELIIIFITLFYLVLIGALIFGFDRVNDFTLEDLPAKTKFSIIIPFRNEAENLPKLLQSISQLNYTKTKFEIIFIDDESNDNSSGIIEKNLNKTKIDFTILKNKHITNSPKKDAITLAISKAKYEWIVTTDADCVLPKFWLDCFDYFIHKNDSHFIVAPVTYHNANSFLKRFQLLDILSLQGATIGGFGIKNPFLCNGANLAYKKILFNELKGFEGNTTIASGDDIFLLEKVLKHKPKTVHYLKHIEATVTTKPQQNFKDLKAQRVRWTAKTSSYKNWFGKLVGVIVFLMNATLICSILFTLAQFISFKFFAYIFIIKFSVDFLLLFKTARFYNQEQYLASYIFSSVLYPLFSVYIVFIALFSKYKWKGRTYSK